MRFDLGTLDSGERSLPFGLLVFLIPQLSLKFRNITIMPYFWWQLGVKMLDSSFYKFRSDSKMRVEIYAKQIRWVFRDKEIISIFSIKTFVASAHLNRLGEEVPTTSVFTENYIENHLLIIISEHPPSLISNKWVFAVSRMTKPTKMCAQRSSAWASAPDQSWRKLGSFYPLSAQRRLWSDWVDAQADLSLRWAHSHFVGFVMRRLKRTKFSLK